jgi:hypothetical protein
VSASRPDSWATPEAAREAALAIFGADGFRRLVDLRAIVVASKSVSSQRADVEAVKEAAAELDEVVRRARASIGAAVSRWWVATGLPGPVASPGFTRAGCAASLPEARSLLETAREVDRRLEDLAGNAAAAGSAARRRAGRTSGWRDPQVDPGRVAIVRLSLQAWPDVPLEPAPWAHFEIATSGHAPVSADAWRDLRAKWATALKQAGARQRGLTPRRRRRSR